VIFGKPGDAKTLIEAYHRSPDADAIIMVKKFQKKKLLNMLLSL
jgi:hypothetical protein